MFSIRFRNKNFILMNKCGSTNLLKFMSGLSKDFIGHNHTTHKCHKNVNNNMRDCIREKWNFDKKLETIIVFRYPHERLRSFYNQNIINIGIENVSFDTAINDLMYGDKKLKRIRSLQHHVIGFNKHLSKLELDFSLTKFLHLDDFDNYMLKTYDIIVPQKYKKSGHKRTIIKIDEKYMNILKEFYKEEYKFLNTRSKIEI